MQEITIQTPVKPMSRPAGFIPRTQAEKAQHAQRGDRIEPYGSPRKVLVEDGHVLVEGYDGNFVNVTPDVAIDLGRTISEAGTETIINKVMEKPIG
ncbi:hypothetical protein [Sphingomonas glacialis]|uniref:hypothetical protein n=1 Tax=Sphingomonas glacialis TaxID=658225 RepID=UPI00138752C8|nr:hypothetical protein [Sphingomonas glacialis]